MRSDRWLHRPVWLIALSAFTADLGYQAVLAVFPLFLVLDLKQPVVLFGVATAVAYGPGALVGYVGGRVGDRVGRKKAAVWGNAFIPLLSLVGLVGSTWESIALLALGWWARNFRSGPRRAMLTEVVAPKDQGKAFGFLHALDIGGGTLAAVLAFVLLLSGAGFRLILLLTLIPLVASTIFLLPVRAGLRPVRSETPTPRPVASSADLSVYRGMLVATALYGFSSYSAGFPILTIARSAHSSALGVLGYVIFLGVSAGTGLLAGKMVGDRVSHLALWGYLAGAVGSAWFVASVLLGGGDVGMYIGMAILGWGLGFVETLEPTIIAQLAPADKTSGGMGSLTAARSAGLFLANIILGLLYHFGPAYAYGYATVLAAAGCVVLLGVGKRARLAVR